ncbi:metal ABC transporter permease [Neomegalonema sp.]|uniref:metal ABC transporter permease n=1 Tax=Neomegalonema sp. TaxID=2039713 RepID=UPI002624ED86|nr:metal ABC transporter permease [Neomegalonema sp.]MDD2870039.1 metal ABC transporter permease [Neomegalonema sp.]
MEILLQALTLQLGHNATLATLGAGMFGLAAGASGAFLVLRKRSLVSDAMAHATLPGLALAFLIMAALGGDGRGLAGLMFGSAVSAALGLLAVDWLTRRTRLTEDAAIGAVLASFFGFGVVLMTVIQTLPFGHQAGLESFLIGSTAGMLRADGLTILVGGAGALILTFLLRRPMTLVAFDPEYAAASGVKVRRIDLAMMALAGGIMVVGLKIVGLVLAVAMLILPAAAARFWTDRVERVVWGAGLIGGASGFVGTALSAVAPRLPTGPMVVLTAAAIFFLSMILAPGRGALAVWSARRGFGRKLRLRAGLLALAEGRAPSAEALAALRRAGFASAAGEATEAGRKAAREAAEDESLWARAREILPPEALTGRDDGATPLRAALTPDEWSLVKGASA